MANLGDKPGFTMMIKHQLGEYFLESKLNVSGFTHILLKGTFETKPNRPD